MLEPLLDLLRAHCAHLPDCRQSSPNLTYNVSDAALSAFAVFFMQSPSFLAHQRDMQRSKGRNNAQGLFGVQQIPSDNQIRNILDPIEPSQLGGLFWQVYAQPPIQHRLSTHTGVAGNLLLALECPVPHAEGVYAALRAAAQDERAVLFVPQHSLSELHALSTRPANDV